MAITLLNPACDTCNECCSPCSDYTSSDQWYALFCNVQTINTGYANRVTHTDGNTYYWDTNTFGDDLAGVMVSWKFTDAGATQSLVGNKLTHVSPSKNITSLNQLIKIYRHASYGAAEASYIPYTVKLFPSATITIVDECSVRYVRGIITGMSCVANVNDPQCIFDKPNTTDPIWAAEHIYSPGSPGVSCGSALEGSTGTAGEILYALNYGFPVDFPSLVGPVSGIKIKAQANNSMLSC